MDSTKMYTSMKTNLPTQNNRDMDKFIMPEFKNLPTECIKNKLQG